MTAIVIAIAAVIALPMVASAAIPNGNTYNACAAKKNGALRVIDTSKNQKCTSTETKLSWSKTGAKGAPGTNGTNGHSVLYGNGAPSNSLGNDGDFYLNRDNGSFGNLYLKIGTFWDFEGEFRTPSNAYSYDYPSEVHFTNNVLFDKASAISGPALGAQFAVVTASGTFADRSNTGWGSADCQLVAINGNDQTTVDAVIARWSHGGIEAAGPGGAYPTTPFSMTGTADPATFSYAYDRVALRCTQTGDVDQIVSNVTITVDLKAHGLHGSF